MSRVPMTFKSCRMPYGDDYVLSLIADIGSTFFKKVSEAESKKEDQGNFGTVIVAEAGNFLFNLFKLEINKDLCIPINNSNASASKA